MIEEKETWFDKNSSKGTGFFRDKNLIKINFTGLWFIWLDRAKNEAHFNV